MAFAPRRTRLLEVCTAPRIVPVDADAPLLRLWNAGPAICFVRTGTGAEVTASADGDLPIPPRQTVLIDKGIGADRLAAVALVAGPSRLYVTPGTGSGG
jgi:hypothetical protein